MKKLSYANLHRLEQKINQHFMYAEDGVTPDDIVHPHFWSHVAKKLHPYDLIHVVAKDNSFTAVFQVIRKTDTAAKVVMKDYTDLSTLDYSDLAGSLTNDYFVKFMGAKEWCVIRKGERGNDVILEGFPTEKEAEKQRLLHIKALAA